MKILYLTKINPLSKNIWIRAFYQSTSHNIWLGSVKINENLNTIIFRDSYDIDPNLANDWWQRYRRDGHKRIDTIEVYEIMIRLKEDLKLIPDFLEEIQDYLMDPSGFYEYFFLRAFGFHT